MVFLYFYLIFSPITCVKQGDARQARREEKLVVEVESTSFRLEWPTSFSTIGYSKRNDP